MLTRRTFLRQAAVAALAAAGSSELIIGCSGSKAQPGATSATSSVSLQPDALAPTSGTFGTQAFDTVVVAMMENRSFDHLLGWLPGANGRQAGLEFPDRAGILHPTHDLGHDFTGCGHADPDHSWQGGQIQLNGGRNDGWLRTSSNGTGVDTYPIGYYTEAALPVLAALARNYATLDGYFSSLMSETYPNRMYVHAARTDRDHNLEAPGLGGPPNKQATLPTIWDRLAAAGLKGRYYYSDVPFLGLWGLRYLPIMSPFTRFLSDAAAGTLPNVAFVDPKFNQDSSPATDQHPFADVRPGDQFISDVFHAVRSSPQWDRTVLVLTYDEWGGFFDHVPPPKVPDDTDPATVDHRCATPGACSGPPDYGQLGFRVPCIVISPFSPSGPVHGGPYEHASILRLIEWRWQLAPLTGRDRSARNLADVLDFTHPSVVPATAIARPAPVAFQIC